MPLRDLLRRGPRNIRKRLFRDVIVIILLTVSAILLLTFIQGISIKDDISSRLIRETSELVKKRFISYLSPYDTSLRLLAQLGETSLLQSDDLPSLKKILQPVFDIHPDIKRITIVHGSGTSRRFTRTDDTGYSASPVQQLGKEELMNMVSYQGALAAPAAAPVFWSESFTVADEESGLSASISLTLPSQTEAVVVDYFIPAEKLISFVSDIEIAENIDIVLFNDLGLYLSRWNLEYIRQPGEDGLGVIPPPQLPTENDIVKLWQQSAREQRAAEKISMQGITWWVGYTPLSDEIGTTWIGVIVPENAIIENVYRQWLELGIIGGAILLVAIFLTVNLVRKYSFQLKDLPQQNRFNLSLKDNVVKLVDAGESATLEFKSTMRHNLQTGKHGKEIEIAWLKTVTAFMNSDGGILLIGVGDDGSIIGTAADEFANEDKCRLHFKNLVNAHIGMDFSRYIHLKVCYFDEKMLLIIECERVRRPVFLSIGKTEDFYIRSGPSSMRLSMSQMVAYLAER